MKDVLEKIVSDPRYQSNINWGYVRPGHPEGTVRAHIGELERNLEALRHKISEDYYWKLKILIHTHDTFKPNAERGVPITHPNSHSSRARKFLAEICQDDDLLNIVQYHDVGYALWRNYKREGRDDHIKFNKLVKIIKDWNLFLLFCLVDGCTAGKSREPLKWFLNVVNHHAKTFVTSDWILEPAAKPICLGEDDPRHTPDNT